MHSMYKRAGYLFPSDSRFLSDSRHDEIIILTLNKLLNFFKMSFYLFSVMCVLAMIILMPVNVKVSLDLS